MTTVRKVFKRRWPDGFGRRELLFRERPSGVVLSFSKNGEKLVVFHNTAWSADVIINVGRPFVTKLVIVI